MSPTTQLETGDLTIPNKLMEPWLGKIQAGSAIAALSDPEPQTFGTHEAFVFDIGEAEFVGQSGAKGSDKPSSTTQTVTPYKFHKTIRFSEEVLWADEDDQLRVIEQILSKVQPALSRALDFGGFHSINPRSGDVSGLLGTPLSAAAAPVFWDASGSTPAYKAIDAADRLVLAEDFVPSGIALDPSFAAEFTTLRTTDGIKLYPDLSLTTEPSVLEGHRSSVSRTVGANGVATYPQKVLAFVGDFDSFRWGVQRSIGLELIRYGDPDGEGDLKRYNQVAFRAEVVYGWGVADTDAFAVIKGIGASS